MFLFYNFSFIISTFCKIASSALVDIITCSLRNIFVCRIINILACTYRYIFPCSYAYIISSIQRKILRRIDLNISLAVHFPSISTWILDEYASLGIVENHFGSGASVNYLLVVAAGVVA